MPRGGGGSKATSSTSDGERGQGGEERAVAGGGQDRVPDEHGGLGPFRDQPAHEGGGGGEFALHLVGGIDQHQPAAGPEGREGQRPFEAVAAVDGRAGAGQRPREGRVLGGMELHEGHAVLRAQQRAGDERRAGIGGGSRLGAHGGERAAEGRGRIGVDAGDALRRLAGLQRFGRGEVVEAAAGVGLRRS